MGKSRFAFVHWAHRLAAAESRQLSMMSPLQQPGGRRESGPDLVRKVEQREGLEFIMSWSVLRLSIALGLVLVASVLATLLWILLGQSTSLANLDPSSVLESDELMQGSGFRGAGSRVGAGLLMDISVLLVGLSSIAGWVGVSWLVI